ncbi:S8 family peptidase [Massilia niastensis]|uniref:S8 family peptidase n=1 Tax=Massilia niastensis TaxID=544911 RepID=UPI000366A36A|nr:S8 family serine peptidase [Massilia niastensis]
MKAFLCAVVLLCAAACAAARAGFPAPQATLDAEQAAVARQVLVMLRLPPQHYRPDAAYGSNYPNDGGQAARRRVALELARTHGLKLVSNWPMPVIGVDCYVMEWAGKEPIEPVLAALARDPRVEWAQPVSLFQGLEGGDPLFRLQPAARDWRLAELHRASTGRKVTVAVIDSGIDLEHPDLAGQVALHENLVDAGATVAEAHGTAVAGVIAARRDNGVGIAGIAPDARLMALRACWETEGKPARCSSFTLGKAINFALMHEARIINLSLGGPPDRLLQALLDAALARGVLVVGAIDPQRPAGGFPASHPGVIAASAAAPAAAHGAIAAPGTDIPTSLPGGRWGFVSGSSYAAAHVSGLAALLVELRPGASAPVLHQTLREQARLAAQHDTAERGRKGGLAGSMDTCALLARAAGTCVCPCSLRSALSPPSLRQPAPGYCAGEASTGKAAGTISSRAAALPPPC